MYRDGRFCYSSPIVGIFPLLGSRESYLRLLFGGSMGTTLFQVYVDLYRIWLLWPFRATYHRTDDPPTRKPQTLNQGLSRDFSSC